MCPGEFVLPSVLLLDRKNQTSVLAKHIYLCFIYLIHFILSLIALVICLLPCKTGPGCIKVMTPGCHVELDLIELIEMIYYVNT